MGKFLKKIKKYFFKKEKKNIEIKKFVLMDNVEFFNSTIGDFSYIARNSIVHNKLRYAWMEPKLTNSILNDIHFFYFTAY